MSRMQEPYKAAKRGAVKWLIFYWLGLLIVAQACTFMYVLIGGILYSFRGK